MGSIDSARGGVNGPATDPVKGPAPVATKGPVSRAVKGPPPGAVKGEVTTDQRPQLATLVDEPPQGADWLHEIKYDGYRLLLFKSGEQVQIMTRNGHDWTNRLPALAADIARLKPHTVVLDGELVAQREDGVSSFALLQQALGDRKTGNLVVFVFDILQLDDWDLRPCRLEDRKAVLESLSDWKGGLRYSDHHRGQGSAMRRQACQMGLEGIIAKQADAPYRAGRGKSWLKLKCQGREEFIVLGWTPPEGSRAGLGALHLGYDDDKGTLHYAGGVGTGFTDRELAALRRRLDGIAAAPPRMRFAAEPPERSVQWVKPELVAEVQYGAWSGSGRVRHAVYLGLREDKSAREVVRPVADPEVAASGLAAGSRRGTDRACPRGEAAEGGGGTDADTAPRCVARAPGRGTSPTPTANFGPASPSRNWRTTGTPSPRRRCRRLPTGRSPSCAARTGLTGSTSSRSTAARASLEAIGEGEAGGAPYLFIKDAEGLRACAQMSAIELHGWGARLDDPLHPDRMVFDLDPGEDVAFRDVVQAALDLRDRLEDLSLTSFCRTTGGKGLHIVVPLSPSADWDEVKTFCRDSPRTCRSSSRTGSLRPCPKHAARGGS